MTGKVEGEDDASQKPNSSSCSHTSRDGTPRLPPIKIRKQENDGGGKKNNRFAVVAETRKELLDEIDSYKTSRDGVSGVTFIIPMDQRKRPHFLRPLTPRTDRHRLKQALLGHAHQDEEQLHLQLQQQLIQLQQQDDNDQQLLQQQQQQLQEQLNEQQHQHTLALREQFELQLLAQQQLARELAQQLAQQEERLEKEQEEQQQQQRQLEEQQKLQQEQSSEQKPPSKPLPQDRRSASAAETRRRHRSASMTNPGRVRKRRAPPHLARSTSPPTPASSISSDGNMDVDRPSETGDHGQLA